MSDQRQQADTPQTAQDIGWAVSMLQRGQRVCRPGWNGKGIWLVLVPGASWEIVDAQGERAKLFMRREASNAPFIAMMTTDHKIVPWLCSQTDLLAQDWELAL
jgi:Protein of unknown function (DUF2829)